jgi:4-diphosphocytidyl-2-C-methyl-D-erythritol kinase
MNGESACPGGRRADQVVVQAPAKVNLHLEVLRQRSDGFHEVETILQAVRLHDRVTVSLLGEPAGQRPHIELRVTPSGAAPADARNTCWKAARLFCRASGRPGRLRIALQKRIPTAAGLGGGSSDAAAVLVACNRLFGSELEASALEELAAEIGSDVPFFVRGGTMMARGRGTELSPLPSIRSGRFLIVKPDIELRTEDVYAGLRMGLTVRGPKANISGMKSMLARFPTSTWFGFNRLEEVVLPSHPVLQRLVLRLKELAPIAMLSGSGAAVVAVFSDHSNLNEISAEFAHPGWFVSVVGPQAFGVEIQEG